MQAEVISHMFRLGYGHTRNRTSVSAFWFFIGEEYAETATNDAGLAAYRFLPIRLARGAPRAVGRSSSPVGCIDCAGGQLARVLAIRRNAAAGHRQPRHRRAPARRAQPSPRAPDRLPALHTAGLAMEPPAARRH